MIEKNLGCGMIVVVHEYYYMSEVASIDYSMVMWDSMVRDLKKHHYQTGMFASKSVEASVRLPASPLRPHSVLHSQDVHLIFVVLEPQLLACSTNPHHRGRTWHPYCMPS